MARIMTPEQRERKNQMDRDRRARIKAAPKNMMGGTVVAEVQTVERDLPGDPAIHPGPVSQEVLDVLDEMDQRPDTDEACLDLLDLPVGLGTVEAPVGVETIMSYFLRTEPQDHRPDVVSRAPGLVDVFPVVQPADRPRPADLGFPAPPVRTFDASQVVVTVGGVKVEGFASGDFIHWTPAMDDRPGHGMFTRDQLEAAVDLTVPDGHVRVIREDGTTVEAPLDLTDRAFDRRVREILEATDQGLVFLPAGTFTNLDGVRRAHSREEYLGSMDGHLLPPLDLEAVVMDPTVPDYGRRLWKPLQLDPRLAIQTVDQGPVDFGPQLLISGPSLDRLAMDSMTGPHRRLMAKEDGGIEDMEGNWVESDAVFRDRIRETLDRGRKETASDFKALVHGEFPDPSAPVFMTPSESGEELRTMAAVLAEVPPAAPEVPPAAPAKPRFPIIGSGEWVAVQVCSESRIVAGTTQGYIRVLAQNRRGIIRAIRPEEATVDWPIRLDSAQGQRTAKAWVRARGGGKFQTVPLDTMLAVVDALERGEFGKAEAGAAMDAGETQ